MNKPTLTRKEIASMLGVSVPTVVRHERNLGLVVCRVRISPDRGRVLYDRARAVVALKVAGLSAQ